MGRFFPYRKSLKAERCLRNLDTENDRTFATEIIPRHQLSYSEMMIGVSLFTSETHSIYYMKPLSVSVIGSLGYGKKVVIASKIAGEFQCFMLTKNSATDPKRFSKHHFERLKAVIDPEDRQNLRIHALQLAFGKSNAGCG